MQECFSQHGRSPRLKICEKHIPERLPYEDLSESAGIDLPGCGEPSHAGCARGPASREQVRHGPPGARSGRAVQGPGGSLNMALDPDPAVPAGLLRMGHCLDNLERGVALLLQAPTEVRALIGKGHPGHHLQAIGIGMGACAAQGPDNTCVPADRGGIWISLSGPGVPPYPSTDSAGMTWRRSPDSAQGRVGDRGADGGYHPCGDLPGGRERSRLGNDATAGGLRQPPAWLPPGGLSRS